MNTPPTPSAPPEASGSAGSALCLACGLCCNGVLHPYVAVAPQERDLVQSLGLRVEPCGQGLGFRLPCSLLREGRCLIYAQARPQVCGEYQCHLLERHRAGLITLDQAGRILQRMGERQAEVVAQLPAGYSLDQVWRELGEGLDGGSALPGTPLMRHLHGQWLLSVSRMLRYARRHFDP